MTKLLQDEKVVVYATNQAKNLISDQWRSDVKSQQNDLKAVNSLQNAGSNNSETEVWIRKLKKTLTNT
jgi:ubiquinone biosynthesis protein Coq4